MVVDSCSLSRLELIQWVRKDFDEKFARIEQCGDGIVYLRILDKLYPGCVSMGKANTHPTCEYDRLKNCKLLQEVFRSVGLSRSFDIDALIRCRYQDNLEMLQYLRGVYEKTMSHPVQRKRLLPPPPSAKQDRRERPTTRLQSENCLPIKLDQNVRLMENKLQLLQRVCDAADETIEKEIILQILSSAEIQDVEIVS